MRKSRKKYKAEDWEKAAIRDFHARNPLDCYRRLTLMMFDQGIVAVSPSSADRILKEAGLLYRWNGRRTGKSECIRPKTPLDLEDARRIVGEYVKYYNEVRLHSAIGYVAPKVRLEGRQEEILEKRDRKLAEARERRKARRQAAREDRLINLK